MGVPETVVLALIAAAASVLAGVVGRGYTRRSKELEAEAARLAAERAREEQRVATEEKRWARLESDVKRLAAEVEELRQENSALRQENAAARAGRVAAEDQLRDQEELIEDLLVYLILRQDWERDGSTPPPPMESWRVRAALRKRRAALSLPSPAPPPQGAADRPATHPATDSLT